MRSTRLAWRLFPCNSLFPPRSRRSIYVSLEPSWNFGTMENTPSICISTHIVPISSFQFLFYHFSWVTSGDRDFSCAVSGFGQVSSASSRRSVVQRPTPKHPPRARKKPQVCLGIHAFEIHIDCKGKRKKTRTHDRECLISVYPTITVET